MAQGDTLWDQGQACLRGKSRKDHRKKIPATASTAIITGQMGATGVEKTEDSPGETMQGKVFTGQKGLRKGRKISRIECGNLL